MVSISDEIRELASRDNVKSKLSTVFELIGYNDLSECSDLGINELKSLKLNGSNEELSYQILLNSLSILCSEDEYSSVSLSRAVNVAKLFGISAKMCNFSELEAKFGASNIGVESSNKCERESFEDSINISSDEEEEEKTEINEDEAVDEKGLRKEVKEYYSAYYNGVVNELLKRYSSMFSSGYELTRPAGILVRDGIIKISGNSRVVSEHSIVTTKIYNMFNNSISFVENDIRSIRGIANVLYETFKNGDTSKVIYFPNKMLEFAYGIKAPTGENQNSINTYNKHSSANSWSGYYRDELTKSVRDLVSAISVGYVINTMEEMGIDDYTSNVIEKGLSEFLNYIKLCLSFCLLFTKYNINNTPEGKVVSAFILRVCDPTGYCLSPNVSSTLTGRIITEGFMGDAGTVPFSYQPRIEEDCYMVELSHEFNHSMAQATPLFAYKALKSLQDQGSSMSWLNMILGQSEDGTILRSSKGSKIDLTRCLTHFIEAGSRAGKGVMTLSLIACGIVSNKNIFYLDRKPDMASLFKYLSKDMFILNGGDIQGTYDKYNQWSPNVMNNYVINTPEEVLKAFDRMPTWSDLGDLVYMRALKLVIGIIMLRGSIGADENLGGQEGILLVVDEFSNFSRAYMSMILQLTSKLPPVTYDKALDSLNNGKITQATFDRVYNNCNYYALSYLNSAMADMVYLQGKKDAGFIPEEAIMSDVIVIGQSLEKGLFDVAEFKDAFKNNSSSGRYKTIDSVGLVRGGFDVGNQSIPFNIVNFKTADAFFGRNMEEGRDVYLAQTNKSSKAYGRLDDKASNFAYMPTFTESIRKVIVNDKDVAKNIELANKCTYFKPFLILNSSGLEDECVTSMFSRVENNAGISKEELTAENPSFVNPNRINEAIGFEDYIKMAGISDVGSILGKSANIADYVVKNILRYPGSWMEFVCDFSPEWLFTIEDIVLAGTTGNCPMFNPSTNPVLEEYYKFNPERFEGSYIEPDSLDSNQMNKFFDEYDNSTEDYSDEELMQESENERLSDVMGDYESIEDEDEIDLFENSDLDETDVNDLKDNQYQQAVLEANALIERLKELGVSVTINGTSVAKEPLEDIPKMGERSVIDESDANYEFSDNYEDSLETLRSNVTLDVLKKFGGAERIRTFRVIGGGIAVNDCFYRCRFSENTIKSVPYDIRREINSGNISSLFDYSVLYNCKGLFTLQVDSMDVFLNKFLPGMNLSDVNSLFNSLPSISTIKIGNNVYTRDEYNKAEEDLETARKSKTLGAYMEKYCFIGCEKSWSFTKDLWNSKKTTGFKKFLGISAGVVGTVTTGVTGLGVKAGRSVASKIGKEFSKGLKDLFS